MTTKQVPSQSTFRIVGVIPSFIKKDPEHGEEMAQAFLCDLNENRWEVVLCHDVTFPDDPICVAAYIANEMVGHVSGMENERFWAMMKGMAKQQGVDIDDVFVYATVKDVKWDSEKRKWYGFEIEANFEDAEPAELMEVDVWGDWGRDLIPLPMGEEGLAIKMSTAQLRHMMSSPHQHRKADLLKQLKAYLEATVHDVSNENRRMLEDVTAWLLAQDDVDLKAMAEKYKHAYSALNSPERMKERCQVWWPKVLNGEEGKRLWYEFWRMKGVVGMPDSATLQQALQELIGILFTAPGELQQSRNDTKRFFSALFYLKTPRKILRRVYGCIVMCYRIIKALHAEDKAFVIMGGKGDISKADERGETLGYGGLISKIISWGAHHDQAKALVAKEMLDDFELERLNPHHLEKMDEMLHESRMGYMEETRIVEPVKVTMVEDSVADDFEQNELYMKLMPIFKNNKKEVVSFVKTIDGQKPTAITAHVNDLLRQEKVLRSGCRSDLHAILVDFLLYSASIQNWNKQVNA